MVDLCRELHCSTGQNATDEALLDRFKAALAMDKLAFQQCISKFCK